MTNRTFGSFIIVSGTSVATFPLETYKSKSQSIFKDFHEYRGSIFYKLRFSKNGVIKKMIFVNSHLYFESNKKGASNLQHRKENFNKIVEEFKLNQHFQQGYNIFFFGDLNFKMTKIANIKNKNNPGVINGKTINNLTKPKIELIHSIKEHLNNIKSNKSSNTNYNNNYLHLKDEIYDFIKKEANSKKEHNNLYVKFLESIEKSRTLLTFKHHIKETDLRKLYELEKNKLKNNKELLKYFETNKKHWFISNSLIPISNPDRILYSVHNGDLSIRKNNLKMYLEPSKSDHKPISLKVDLNF